MSHLNINGVDKPLDHVYVKARTENLFDASTLANNLHLSPSTGFPSLFSGRIATTTTIDVSAYTELTLTFSIQIASGTPAFMYSKFYNGSLVERVAGFESGSTIDVSDTDSLYIAFYVGGRNITTDDVNWVMLNTGSTALPYQPYLITKEAWEARTRVILHGLTNPLCGINTHKDTLDLSIGLSTMYVKELVLTGDEDWSLQSVNDYGIANFQILISDRLQGTTETMLSSHFVRQNTQIAATQDMGFYIGNRLLYLRCDSSIGTNLSDFQAWLAAQKTKGTPVSFWYILATPETEQITVPSNLTGIVEGFLTQTGTPTPTNPIYPTANGTLEQGGTYSLDTGAYAIAWGRADTFTGTSSISARCYGLPVKSWEIDGNSQQSGTPSQDDPVYPEFVGERTENLFGVAIEQGSFNNTTGALYDSNQRVRTAEFIEQTGQMTIDTSTGNDVVIYVYSESGTFDSESSIINWQSCPYTFSIASGKKFKIAFRKPGNPIISTADVTGIMLNFGSTALPYEPYGYSIQTYSSIQNTVSGQTPLTLTDSVGHNLISWDGEGATTSSGTPAPTSPVTVSGWGDKTANLFDDFQIIDRVPSIVDGELVSYNGGACTDLIAIPNGDLTLASVAGNIPMYIFLYATDKSYIGNATNGNNTIKSAGVSGSENARFMRIRTDSYSQYQADPRLMLNTGSTPLPYEPYGYKLSLTSAGQTTPVYLGQVPTTRRVKKLVFDGSEGWAKSNASGGSRAFFELATGVIAIEGQNLCTHFVANSIYTSNDNLGFMVVSSGNVRFRISDIENATIDDWENYLQQQYQNETPVTVWYVLAEPTTGIVNEPLMKIGNYADSITSTQAGVTIPTAKGNATLTTSNTVQPSTIHATYDKYISGGDVPVYLGQVPTTRRIKKMVFDGTENWFATGGGDTLVYNTSINASGVPDSTAGSICTHLEYGDRYTQGQYDIGESGAIRISAKGFASLSAFTQFLVDEYANGMPVTVWYVLATPTTGVVNEPLCKIGTYADTLTSDQAGITIPTANGSTTISVDTALAPSRFEIKVHAKPL